ncbi:unnamed protein product [Leptosia nina]|uniref:Uncharacterized protein n=1 Tax=Leptosia nina TaxID=320188 RepID=A0AAV1K0Y0_9NEOP
MLVSTKPTRSGHKLAVGWRWHVVTAPSRLGLAMLRGERRATRDKLNSGNPLNKFLLAMQQQDDCISELHPDDLETKLRVCLCNHLYAAKSIVYNMLMGAGYVDRY